MRICSKHIFIAVLSLSCCLTAYADGGVNTGYSPYSKFGVGRLSQKGTAYSQSMGGAGVANRNTRYINILNPAAVTARDTLAFMADFSLEQNNSYYRQGDRTSVDNTFNVSSLVMSFPIWKSSAFMVGIKPYSGLGYKFSEPVTDQDIIGHVGNITDYSIGDGSLYETFLAAGVTFWKRLSFGAQANLYFGNLEKTYARTFASDSYASIYGKTDMSLWGFTGRFGIQYEQPVGKDKLCIGATYTMNTKLNGKMEISKYTLQSSYTKQLEDNSETAVSGVSLPDDFSVGIVYRHGNILTVAFDYSMSDWKNSGMDSVAGFKSGGFLAGRSQSFNAGVEYTPNRNDIRYYMRRCTYRIGGYYSDDYYTFGGNKISAAAVTLGMTLPVFRWSNGITLGMELGQRGKITDNMVRERFVNFKIGINIYDIWFVKPKYE